MFDSIRIRLTFWYAASLALLLGVFTLTSYIVLDRTVRQIADDSLEDTATALVETLRAQKRLNEEQVLTDETVRGTIEDFRFQYIVFAVFDERSRSVAVSPRLDPNDPGRLKPFNLDAAEIPSEGLASAVNENEGGFLTITTANEPEVRIFVRRANFESRTLLVAAVRPLRSQLELLDNVRIFIIAGIPFTLILSSIGGYYLAVKSLRPVGQMAETAASITSRSLNERLPRGKANDELAELADAFNSMLVRLETAFELQKRFMADASHELRTPLAIVRGESEVSLQKEERSESEYRESLDVIRLEAARLSRIVEDLFLLAKADAGGFIPKSRTFYLDEVVTECARAVRTLIEERGLELRLEVKDGLAFKGDEALVRRLILNLLDNAVKYSEPGGAVGISCAHSNGAYRIEVTNSGDPIPERDRSHIFERFFRVDRARSHNSNYAHGTGAGLGLAIASSIANAHKGTLELVSSDEEATVFRATLPDAGRS